MAGGDETSNAPSRGSDRAERGRGRGSRGGRGCRGGRGRGGRGGRGAIAESKGRLLQSVALRYPSVPSYIAGGMYTLLPRDAVLAAHRTAYFLQTSNTCLSIYR